MYIHIYICICIYICIYVCRYIYASEEINVLWRVIANERRAHRRCTGTDRDTATRPATACSALLRVRHRLGAPAPAVGAKSGSCGEEQTEARCWYFCAVAPSPTASAGPHDRGATCDPYISPGFCLFRISTPPQSTLHTLPAAKASICRPAAESQCAFFREPANSCACCSKPGMGMAINAARNQDRSGKGLAVEGLANSRAVPKKG